MTEKRNWNRQAYARKQQRNIIIYTRQSVSTSTCTDTSGNAYNVLPSDGGFRRYNAGDALLRSEQLRDRDSRRNATVRLSPSTDKRIRIDSSFKRLSSILKY